MFLSRVKVSIYTELLNEHASLVPWNDILEIPHVNEKLSRFNELLTDLYDRHAPIQTVRVT